MLVLSGLVLVFPQTKNGEIIEKTEAFSNRGLQVVVDEFRAVCGVCCRCGVSRMVGTERPLLVSFRLIYRSESVAITLIG